MVAIKCQVTLKSADNIPANFITNVLAFDMPIETADFADLQVRIKGLYDYLGANVFSNHIAQNGHTTKFYDALQTPPNYPIIEYVWNLASAPTGNSLPHEVALVVSFQGARISGTAQARRRGRNYVGPCKDSLNVNGRPTTAAINHLVNPYNNLLNGVASMPGFSWCVWSGTSQTLVEIEDGWVDDAWDTQRRRGVDPTARTTFDFA